MTTQQSGMLAAAVAIGGAISASAAFDPTYYPTAAPGGFGSLLGELDVADTSYTFTFEAEFSTSGYVNEFGGFEFDRTQVISRVYEVTTQTVLNMGANSLTLEAGDRVFSYSIRLVEDSNNTIKSVTEFQVGLLDGLNSGLGFDASVVKGRGFVSPTGGVATPTDANGVSDLVDFGTFGGFHTFDWADNFPDQLQNDQFIEVLLFTGPTPFREGLGNLSAPPGQISGVDPNANELPILIPGIPAPGVAGLFGMAGLIAARRRR